MLAHLGLMAHVHILFKSMYLSKKKSAQQSRPKQVNNVTAIFQFCSIQLGYKFQLANAIPWFKSNSYITDA